MKTNRAGINLIKSFESLKLVAYLPTPNDVWTIGYGHTHGVKKGDKCTELEAEAMLRQDLAIFEQGISEILKNPSTTENQFSAMVSLAFNIGLSNFRKSSVLKYHNQCQYDEAAQKFSLWIKQNGKILKGLQRRRESEIRLYKMV